MGNFAGREGGEGDSADPDLDSFVPRHPSGRTVGGPSRFEVGGSFNTSNEGQRLGDHGKGGRTISMDLALTDAMDIEDKDDGEDGEDEIVPTVFRWEHGGRQVYITGTFNNWEKQIPMHRSGNDFTYIHNLSKGKHAFKFIVDDEWRFAPDQPTCADIEGRINNFIDVSDFQPYTGDEDFRSQLGAKEADEEYSQWMPDIDEYTKEPPPLPPHLRHIILNKTGFTPAPQSVPGVVALPGQQGSAAATRDPMALPVPQHVALNHLYCTAIKDGMMVLGMTQRYKTKFVTTVYYSVMPST